MPDLLNVTYAQTGNSTKQNALGMREMQARAYEKRNAQFLLLKAPPASGKSRALMYLALDKIRHQGLKKAIIAVPQMAIGSSFRDTDLKSGGFFANWHIDAKYNLCTPGSEGKVDAFERFFGDSNAHYLLCTHATLVYAYDRLKSNIRIFSDTVLAIDEFHHASAEEGNKLGEMLDDVMAHTNAHVVAMTGSYFRGDQVPILKPETEQKFTQVTYTYYEQLNGYKHLKSLGLGYHFYHGRYFDAVKEVLDLSKKTIIHIPSVNSRASTGDKINEVDAIVDIIGKVENRDARTGILSVRTRAGKLLKVADLVTDTPERANVLNTLRNIKKRDEMDIIIALGMAKEGFDWPWCEHALTIGYRASLTEVVQIIGRATRDCEGKTHAQFTNLIAQPDAEDEDVKNAVNNLLKAIALSLLMRDVLAPNIKFKPRSDMKEGELPPPDTIVINDDVAPHSPKIKKIFEEGGVQQILTTLVSNPEHLAPAVINNESELVTRDILPKIIMQTFPDLTPEEVGIVREAAVKQLAVREQGPEYSLSGKAVDGSTGTVPVIENKKRDEKGDGTEQSSANNDFVRFTQRLLDVDKLPLDLIDRINPFQGAYEILSKSMDAPMLKTIQDQAASFGSKVTEEEAVMLWPDIQKYVKEHGKPPSLEASDAYERRLAEALAYIRAQKARKMQEEAQ